MKEYRTVLKLNPDLPGIHEEIGKNLLATGKEAEALREFQSELEVQPNSASACMYAGQVLLLMGDDEAASKMLNRALQMDRPPPETFRLLGKLDLHRKDYHSAVTQLTYYIAVRKDDSTAYYLLSKAYRALGNEEQMKHALALFEKTSRDAKARSRAQAGLEALNGQKQLPEDSEDPNLSGAH